MNTKNIIIHRIIFFFCISLSILFSLSLISCISERAEDKKYVIGIINPNPRLMAVVAGFKTGMTGYGYVEAENMTYINISDSKKIDQALEDFKEKKVDLVLTFTTPATRKAKNSLKGTSIPVVFGTSFDPVSGGIVKSLTNKEENITGIKVGGNMQNALQWLMAISKGAKRVFVPVKFDTKAATLSLNELKEAAVKLDIDFVITELQTLQDLEHALSSMPEDIGSIFIVPSIFVVSNLNTVLDAAAKRKLPTGAGSGQYKNGVIITYGQNHKRSGEQAGRLAHKILQGTPASSLPVETADFFLGINLKTAQAIGLNIPYDIVDHADFIVR